MKKLLFSIVALFTLVACEKGEIGSKTAPMTVEITIANGSSATKAVTSPATSGAFVCEANDLTAVFANANGIIIKSVAFEEATASNGKYTFTGLTTEVSKVAVIALRDNDLNGITTLAEVKDIWVTEEQMDAEADELIAYGEDLNPTQSNVGDNNYILSATVRVLPNHSRIEVTSIGCTDFGSYSALNLISLGLEDYMHSDADDLTGKSLNKEISSVNPGEGKVWSWNLIGQSIPVMKTYLVMEVVGDGYTVVAPERLLTVNSYKVNGGNITYFEAGNVYKFAINFGVDKLSGNSDVNVSAEVTVEIDQWIVNETQIGFEN